ncbi:MAG: DNA primase [Acidobacteriota bacterium]|nr:DNA primase [Acidobacteriota bacterium]
MAFSDDEIAQVRAASDLVALISETVALKRSGRRWSGLCPFHAEKTPSFSVNAEEGRYYCFGCRASGDAITWVRETHHLDFVDAVRLLADRAGIELHEDANAGPARKERQEFLQAMDDAVNWYHDRLLHAPDARPAREYLKARGIDGAVARRFKLGWAPDEWDALVTSLKLSEKVLTGTGLGFVNSRDRRQDALRARVIFPIFDASGRAIALGGRILPQFATRADGRVEAKYKNSPETAIYSKRRTLYGLNFAKDEIIKSGEIIVCEGYTDVIAFFQAGMARAVATCGTALGEEHFKTMRNFAQRIVLAYDADAAGQSAAASVYQWERQHEVDVFVARLPAGTDPAELAQRDPEALRTSVREALPFMRFRVNRVLDAAHVDTAEGRARAARSAMAVIAEHPDELVRDEYVMAVADRLRLDVNTLRTMTAEVPAREDRPPRRVDDDNVARGVALPTNLPRPGQAALRMLVHAPARVRDRLTDAYFVNELQREVYRALAKGQSAASTIDLLEREGRAPAASLLARLVVDEMEDDPSAAEVTAVVALLVRAAVDDELRRLGRDLRESRVSPELAQSTIHDVKERLELLESVHGDVAERDLREWLVERARTATS